MSLGRSGLVVVDLHELAPVGGRASGGCHRRRFEWFAQVREGLTSRGRSHPGLFPLVCPACGGDIRLISFRLLHECETFHGLRALGSPPAAAAILAAIRGRSAKSSCTLASRSSHHRCRPLVARPPTGASSCRSMTIATSFKPRPTNCPRSIFTASERCRMRPTHGRKLRTGTRSAQTREKRHRSGCGAL